MSLLLSSPTRVLPVLLLLGTTAACGGDDDDGATIDAGPPDANPLCIEATAHNDLPWIQENILTPSCSRFSACHQGRALDAAELSLEDGMSHDNLVGVDSTLFPQYKRVVAGDPENSYLMIILGQFDGPLTDKGTMPYNSPLLCPEMRDAVERWIRAGAPVDVVPPDAGI